MEIKLTQEQLVSVRAEEIDAMKRLNSSLSRLSKGSTDEIELAMCDIKHTMGCVSRMMFIVNSGEQKV